MVLKRKSVLKITREPFLLKLKNCCLKTIWWIQNFKNDLFALKYSQIVKNISSLLVWKVVKIFVFESKSLRNIGIKSVRRYSRICKPNNPARTFQGFKPTAYVIKYKSCIATLKSWSLNSRAMFKISKPIT